MKRAILNVATGRYVTGQHRLIAACQQHSPAATRYFWKNEMPPGSPTHHRVPYAFKAHAIFWAQAQGEQLLLWADASILPIRSLEPLWDRIERDGYWIGRNGWKNGEWCVSDALELFGMTREEAMEQEHVVATSFGVNLASDIGQQIAREYFRFATNGSFCGPWTAKEKDPRVRGHRHDQTALSVIAHRMGLKLTASPDIFAYRGGETENTIVVADGAY